MSTDDTNNASGTENESTDSRRRILIGSQRDPDAYRPKRPRDWGPAASEPPAAAQSSVPPPPAAEAAPPPPVASVVPSVPEPPAATAPVPSSAPPASHGEPESVAPRSRPARDEGAEGEESSGDRRGGRGRPRRGSRDRPQKPSVLESLPRVEKTTPVPSKRNRLDDDLIDPELGDQDLAGALSDLSMDDVVAGGESLTSQALLERESKHIGRVVAVRRDVVFVELGGREQGILPLNQLPEPPEPGQRIEVVVERFNADEGLYQLIAPDGAMSIGDWEDLSEGMIVEARVTGHNTGGLEVQVNRVRGFIPVSQVAMYRVENLEEFVGQKWPCVVTDVNPDRRRLVLSRRAMLEREKEEARQKLWTTLEAGQIHEGVVRKIMDFGAFVDLGGVDGLLHISQLSWARVKHPSEVLHEGQTIKVKISKIDPDTRKISLTYREMLENPWESASAKYPANTVARGVVTKLMEFGAFVQLEPGVEGLVHISELSPKRVWRVAEVVQEGQEVEVLVLSVDRDSERMSLSMKALAAKPEPDKNKKDEEESIAAPPPPAARKKPTSPLKGGVGQSSGGEQFGLRW
jgi:small subunit ribosomal protein S1